MIMMMAFMVKIDIIGRAVAVGLVFTHVLQ